MKKIETPPALQQMRLQRPYGLDTPARSKKTMRGTIGSCPEGQQRLIFLFSFGYRIESHFTPVFRGMIE
ncbi:MAG: hypothetical protein ACLR1K_02240 [Oscillospiraceae bacterium]